MIRHMERVLSYTVLSEAAWREGDLCACVPAARSVSPQRWVDCKNVFRRS